MIGQNYSFRTIPIQQAGAEHGNVGWEPDVDNTKLFPYLGTWLATDNGNTLVMYRSVTSKKPPSLLDRNKLKTIGR